MAASKSWPSTDLASHLESFLAGQGALAGRLCVGLSGGRDSVVLLHAATQLNLGDRLTALHVHHGLSPNADAWERHCAELCADLGVRLRIERVDVPRGTNVGLEAAARAARYAVFERCAADVLLLAHHRGDQAETVLFNLIRGTGTEGAAGMPRSRRLSGPCLMRPLLDVPAARIAAYAEANQLAWIEDESNADPAFSRNYLRHAILPHLEERFPGAAERFAAAADRFREANGLLADLAALDWDVAEGSDAGLPMRKLRQMPLSRLKNLLRWRLRVLGWRSPVADRLEEFARQLLSAKPDRHPQLTLPEGEMRVREGRLVWVPGTRRGG